MDQGRIELIRHLQVTRFTGVDAILEIGTREARPLIDYPDRRSCRVFGCSPCWNRLVEVLDLLVDRREGDDLGHLFSLSVRRAFLSLSLCGHCLTIILIAELLALIWSTSLPSAAVISAVFRFPLNMSLVPRCMVTMSAGFFFNQSTSWFLATMSTAMKPGCCRRGDVSFWLRVQWKDS